MSRFQVCDWGVKNLEPSLSPMGTAGAHGRDTLQTFKESVSEFFIFNLDFHVLGVQVSKMCMSQIKELTVLVSFSGARLHIK